MRINRTVLYYLFAIFLIIIASIIPEAISGFSPFEVNLKGASPPGAGHLFGTDFLGRDILSRTLIGGRISIIIGVAARIGSIFIGTMIGLIVGFSGKGVKTVLNSIVEVFLAIPALLLAMGLAVVLNEGKITLVVAIVVGTWAPVARFISARVSEIRTRDFVLSARAIGAGRVRIIIYYVLPALFTVLIPLITTGIATSIMMEATLSFLGLGGGASVEAIPSWGLMIQEGAKFIFDAPWIIIPPSVFLSILILSFNQIGDKIVTDSSVK